MCIIMLNTPNSFINLFGNILTPHPDWNPPKRAEAQEWSSELKASINILDIIHLIQWIKAASRICLLSEYTTYVGDKIWW